MADIPKVTGKVVLAGETRVGKTTLFNRFRNVVDPSVQPTIAPASATFTLSTEDGLVGVNLWDTAGQEQYAALAPLYFRNAHVAVLVFDLTSRVTFDAISPLHEMISKTVDVPGLIVVGNKKDLPEPEVTAGKARKLVQKLNGRYLSVSAKSGDGWDELAMEIAQAVREFGIHKVESSQNVQGSTVPPDEARCVSCTGAAGGGQYKK
jgi:small GTP-binding protein